MSSRPGIVYHAYFIFLVAFANTTLLGLAVPLSKSESAIVLPSLIVTSHLLGIISVFALAVSTVKS